jgi:hypothetical protein
MSMILGTASRYTKKQGKFKTVHFCHYTNVTERETDRQTDRQTEGQTIRQTNRQANRQAGRLEG